MTTPVRVLILHESPETAARLVEELARGGFQPTFERVTSREALDQALSTGAWDIVLSDYRVGDFGALAALALLKERETDLPFIVVSEEIGEETAVRAIKAGAHNCIPLSALGHLAATVERELREGLIRRERRQAREALRESESRFRVLVNNAPIVLFAFDRDGVVTHLEGRGLEPLGLRPGESVGRSAYELSAESPKALHLLRRALEGEAFQETVELRNLVFEVDFAPRRDEHGTVLDVIGVATNVTDQRRAERAANQSEMRYRMLFEGNLAGVYRTTLEGKILDCNDSFAQIFGYSSREEVLALPAWDFYPTPEDRGTALARLKERGTLANFEQCLRRKDGSHVWVLENGNLIEGTDGKPSLVEGTVIDITERKRSEEQVKHLAFHDSLTGLPNRLLFNDRLRVAMVHANRYREKLAVLFLDIDRFKVINDSLGHPIGDELLRRVAERVGGCIRQEDTIARLGGDEFTVLLPGIAKEEDAATIANKILEAVRLPFFIEHRELFITTSIGVTLFPEDGTDAESLVRNADTAMYRAKEQGRDTTRLYAPAMNTKALERLSLEGRLRQALQNQELLVYYQPLIDLATGRVRGAEALLRWQHPELGLVSPGEFIAIAEVSGLIVPIGQWVLRTACAQARAWQLQGHPKFSVAVNLSARQFQQADLVFQVTEALHEADLPPASLDLEITESNAMQNAELSIATLQDLKSLGVSLSMDDFGTGYSSLNYLKRFPIDRIKIDQSFVRDVNRDPDDAAIATAIIAMAHSLELTAVAEGVETEEQLQFLLTQRCDEMQGYLFSRPLPAAEFQELLASKKSLPLRARRVTG
jgi:diguanylate cyclase (GGDEF)-like protein/PAS domain S-box-containing protein